MGKILSIPFHKYQLIKNISSNLELDLLYAYDGTVGKTLTNFDCGDNKLLLVYFDDLAISSNVGCSVLVTDEPTDQLVVIHQSTRCTGTFLFYNGMFSQKEQRYDNNGTYISDNTYMVIRRIYAVKGFKTEYAVDQCPYLIGDIYLTMNETHPRNRWPGTEWESISSFLLGSSEQHPLGSTGGTENETLKVNQLPPHSHPIDTTLLVATGIANGGNFGAFRYMKGDATFSTDVVGSGKPVNNMPPYTTVNMWKRVS